MTLASLAAAGASLGEVSRRLQGLGVPFGLSGEPVEVNGVGALRVSVSCSGEEHHRNLRDVEALIDRAGLPVRAAERAAAAFRRLAEAEGSVHRLPPEEVTFHEVGAVDSIVDVVGTCVALELLEAETVSCGPLPMGSGVVSAAHGPLPVPGPATLEVLKGSRVRWTEEPREMTTPTGAALMQSLTGGHFTEAAPPMTLRGIGYGAGRSRMETVPNLLRAAVGEIEGPAGDLLVLEANVDDASGELLGAAVEALLRAGALDAWLEPIVMKRGRGAYKACALAREADRDQLSRLLMRETGALGVRYHPVGRTAAARRLVEVRLPYGTCRVKVGELDGEVFVVAPEYADAARLSRETGLPLPQVYADARASWHPGEEPG
ncbi:MAG: nickel pincer cofactor biosynthesis protein LarC [Rubrobacter sp.]|nr:nickel pincer cofactor biosynthesis protein LarC [Rubrobacter sp.]